MTKKKNRTKKRLNVKKKSVFTDAFGNPYILKRSLIFLLGSFTYKRFNGYNKLKVTGTENIKDLPPTNVLFVSNHQTYFADVMALYHVFSSVNNGYQNTIKNPIYLLNPNTDFYYVAAKETMNSGLLPKLFKLTGAITVKRTWREAGKNVDRKVDLKEIDNIQVALENGWVVTFPQGTTTPYAPGRRGTAKIILRYKPIVIPVVIDGFRRSFDKKGLKIKKKGIEQSITFKEPLNINYEYDSPDLVMEKIMTAIEQTEEFDKIGQLQAQKKENEESCEMPQEESENESEKIST